MEPIAIALIGLVFTNVMTLGSVLTLQRRIQRYELWVNRDR